MEGWTRDKIIEIISSDMDCFNKRKEEIRKGIEDLTQETIEFLEGLLEQIPESISGPLLSKTPKISRKRNTTKRIQTIPEDDMMEINPVAADITIKIKSEEKEMADAYANRRSKREASKKAEEIMKQQQSTSLVTKLRRPSNDENDASRLSKASSRGSRSKRLRSIKSSDEEQEEVKRPAKQIKNDTRATRIRSTRNKPPVDEIVSSSAEDEVIQPKAKKLSSVKRKHESSSSRKSTRASSLQSLEPDTKKANIVDETLETPSADDTIEPSMYEDAIAKAVPIMNSTMKPTSFADQTRTIIQTPAANTTRNLNSAANETRNINSGANETRNINPTANDTRTIKSNTNEPLERMMNVTVVLEPVRKMNETITVSKALVERSNSGSISNSTTKKVQETANERKQSPFSVPLSIPKIAASKLNPVVELDPLITDDDSSPERKVPRGKKLQKKRSVAKKVADAEREVAPKQKRITRSSLLSEDEVNLTPGRVVLGDMNSARNKKDIRNAFKQNALFSPYAKESVKKRVEAFEQAGYSSPVVEIDAGMRLTRTKTRAIAAANENAEPHAPTITQKLARKSLAKAKQISRAKEAKEVEETKENRLNSVQKLLPNDKLVQKQQQRTTPNSKIRPVLPSSVSRNPTTPSNSQTLSNYSKGMTGSRTNIVTNVDSFIQAKGSAQKPRSDDKMLEEKRRRQEEDAKRKRDEALKIKMEEKRRKREEKEQKIRLAKELQLKQEMEKRIKAEKDKEERAKLALLAQEKQREEAERKRMAQLQRAQEKEEKRREEEHLQLQKLREQEETERLLAEQKRREQEAQRRKLLADAKAQQATTEALRLKIQMQAKKQQVLTQNKQQQPHSYKIDSEPDSDSDDELRPKHEIPPWAKPHYRQKHLAMQEYVPMQAVMRLFDVKKCTPDLSELFQGIDKNRLKRTSSAIWKTPPRFSMMEALN